MRIYSFIAVLSMINFYNFYQSIAFIKNSYHNINQYYVSCDAPEIVNKTGCFMDAIKTY